MTDLIQRTSVCGTGEATFSGCFRYRYTLSRQWQQTLFDMEVAERTCVFLMLNPSTADEDKLDPTVTRCVAHAKRWHFDAMTVLNLFAWRATDPADMKAAEEPIGKLNDAIIREVTSKAAMTVLAFGNHAAHLDRYQFVGCLPQDRLFFFQKNKTGHPKHPLYVSKQADLYRWQDGSIVTIDEIRQKGRLDGAAGNAVQSRHDIGVKHGIST